MTKGLLNVADDGDGLDVKRLAPLTHLHVQEFGCWLCWNTKDMLDVQDMLPREAAAAQQWIYDPLGKNIMVAFFF